MDTNYRLILAYLACVVLCGCDSGTQQLASLSEQSTPVAVAGGLPALPVDPPRETPPRESSGETSIHFHAQQHWAFGGAEHNHYGATCNLVAAAGETAWAIYQLEGLHPQDELRHISIQLDQTGLPSILYFAVSDYEHNCWQFGGFNPAWLVNTNPGPEGWKLVSDSGFSYIALVIHDGESVKIRDLDIVIESPALAPTGISASTTHATRIELNWSEPEPGYEAVRVTRRLPGGEFEFMADVPAGTVGWTDQHDPADNPLPHDTQVGYQIYTVLDGRIGLPSRIVYGRRQIQPPVNLTASVNAYPDKIVLNWEHSPEYDGYQIFRDNSVTPLDVVGNVNEYEDLTAAAGPPHEYWLRSTLDGETSATSDAAWGQRTSWVNYPLLEGGPHFHSPDLALVNERPVLVWWDSFADSTGFAHAANAQPRAVDDWVMAGTLPVDCLHPCVAENRDVPVVAGNAIGEPLSYIRGLVAEPSGPEDWISVVADPTPLNEHTRLVVGNMTMLPVIAYYYEAQDEVRVVWSDLTRPEKPESWHVVPVETGNGADVILSPHVALYTIGLGQLAVAYYLEQPGDLKIARSNLMDLQLPDPWEYDAYNDTPNDAGRWCASSNFNSGPTAYYDSTAGQLLSTSGVNSFDVLDDVAVEDHLAVSNNDSYTAVCYRDYDGGDSVLKLAWRHSQTSDGWVVEEVLRQAAEISEPDMIVGEDFVLIVFRDARLGRGLTMIASD